MQIAHISLEGIRLVSIPAKANNALPRQPENLLVNASVDKERSWID
jgi:hypothetical protein